MHAITCPQYALTFYLYTLKRSGPRHPSRGVACCCMHAWHAYYTRVLLT